MCSTVHKAIHCPPLLPCRLPHIGSGKPLVRSEDVRQTRIVNTREAQTKPSNWQTTTFIMALGKKAYPKATVKKIIKAHSNHNLKKNADVTVRLTQISNVVHRRGALLTAT